MKRTDGVDVGTPSDHAAAKRQRVMDEGPLDEFQGLKGHLLVEAVFGKYGAGTATIPWLLNGKERAIKPDSTNRPIMESLAEAYADRILTSGLNVDCSGRAWMVFGQNNSLPVHAITFNHRSEAMYRALTRDPESPYVKKALSTGLESVRMLRPDTPDSVRRMLCSMHNQYHEGTGETWLALLDKAEELMEAWDAKNNGPGGSGLTTRHKEYDTCLERFLFKEKQATAWGGSLNFFKSTTILNNYLTKFAVKDEVRRFCNERMNFADFKLVNRDIIMMLHQLVVVIVNGMVKFYPKEYIGATLFEAIKFCVPTRHSGGGERLIPQVFTKTGGETVATMSLLTAPMASSAVFKKLDADTQNKIGKGLGKDKTSTGSGKGKSKKGRKGKGKDADANMSPQAGSTPEEPWSPMVYPIEGSSQDGRQKTALDDFMSVVLGVIRRFQGEIHDDSAKSLADWDMHARTMFSHAMSYFMEFAWTGAVALNGKVVRTYTNFRDELEVFASTACQLAASSASSSSSVAQSGLTLGLTFASFLDGDASGPVAMSIGHVKDETDEAKAMTRIRSNLPIVLDSGMDGFVSDVLPLPLEFHEGFTRAKASLGRDREINAESTPMQVLHKICAELQQSIPPIWISFAADVSELHAARLDFVNGSSKVFSGRKDLLEKFLSIRAYYTLSLLRDLASLKKTNFAVNINYLVSSLHVDLGNLMEIISKTAEHERRQKQAPPGESNVASEAGLLQEALKNISKPHPVAPLVSSFDVLQSNETWAANWASLLDTKTTEGAYSFLKVFAPGGVANELQKLEVPKADDDEDGQGAQGESEKASAEEADAGQKVAVTEIRSRMYLNEIFDSGMSLVEKSEEYRLLFGTEKGQINSVDMKRLEANLEAYLWTWFAASATATKVHSVLKWNFGSAQDEADAIAAGGKAKLGIFNKQLDGQRVLVDLNYVKDGKQNAKIAILDREDIALHFVGPISVMKSSQSLHIGKIFNIDFYINPVPTPTLCSNVIVPAWSAAVTPKSDKATVTEDSEEITIAISKTLDVTRADDTSAGGDDDGKGKEQIVVKLRIRKLVPIPAVVCKLVTAKTSEPDDLLLPLIKFSPKKPKGATEEDADADSQQPQPVGFGAAIAARRAEMSRAGLEWRVVPASKDQKKAEQVNRKLLAGAKHLLK